MSLGFTVEELVPAARGGRALAMGLTRVAESDWLFPDPDTVARDAVFDRHPDAVEVLSEGGAAAREAAMLVAGEPTLERAARRVWEDLCVLEPRGEQYVLTGGALGFPTHWRLQDKLGLAMPAIHVPIDGYAEQLSAGVDHFFRTVAAGPIFGRANLFVVPTDAWRYQPSATPEQRFEGLDPATAGTRLFVRCERQTLRRLPETGAMLFTIGIAVAALDVLSPRVVRRVADAVTKMPPGEQARRGTSFYVDALTAYAARREGEAA